VGPGENDRVYTVSDVTADVKAVLEASLPTLWVEGEISNFVHHTSGHMYFTLKDEKSQLSSVMFKFRNAKLHFTPESGMKVLAWGRIGVYEPAGKYQLYVERMRPAGVGDLAAAFEKLKRKLAREGLFDELHKKPIPAMPGTVAAVTSPTGAAVRDVIRGVRSRFPAARVVVVPTPVQGGDAPAGIVRSISLVDKWGEVDVMIVGRGGGSLEDLWAFNDEGVARAIFAARTPVVSAVGHEVDFTIADFVADVRAATPSNAAELVVPDREELGRAIGALESRLATGVGSRLRARAERVERYRSAYVFRLPRALVEGLAERVDELAHRVGLAASGRLASAKQGVERAIVELRLADPSHILERGFAAVAVLPELSPVRTVADVGVGSEIRVTLADGALDARVASVATKRGRRS
jgi:exodeoxyribonuclease VII large subunit